MNSDNLVNFFLVIFILFGVFVCCFTSYNDEQIHKVCMNSIDFNSGDLVQIKGSNRKLIVQSGYCYERNKQASYRVLNEFGDTNLVFESDLERYEGK